MFKLASSVVVAAAITFSGLSALNAPSASADAPPLVGRHRHYILVNEEKVYIGPNFCDIAASDQGFAAFHKHVHLTDPGVVDVRSEACPATDG